LSADTADEIDALWCLGKLYGAFNAGECRRIWVWKLGAKTNNSEAHCWEDEDETNEAYDL
jgi:hypothetical protein